MNYEIKSIPTTYAGVNFRSRLEARWAAFFDLCGWKWDYEPFDLEGWAPDFLIKTSACDVLVEVKPVDLAVDDYQSYLKTTYGKAFAYWPKYQVLLLGIGPLSVLRNMVGVILDEPDNAKFSWLDVADNLEVNDCPEKWREAGNLVQWRPDNDYHLRRRRSV